MRIIVLQFFLLLAFSGHAQTERHTGNKGVVQQYATLQVKQALSGPNFSLVLFAESEDDYLGLRIEDIKHKGFKVTGKDGKITMIHNEVEALNFMATQHWNIQHVYTYKAFGDLFIRYLFSKDR